MNARSKFSSVRLLCLVALLMLGAETKSFGVQACIAARFNDYRDFGCRLPPGPFRDLTIAAFNAHCEPCGGVAGMPQWWVSEPYINLWMADEPLSYPTSSGQKMSFRWTYRQRYSVPQISTFFNYGNGTTAGAGRDGFSLSPYRDMRTFGASNGAWYYNWLSDITFWDYKWEGSGGTKFGGNYEAFWYRPEGGIRYFTNQAGLPMWDNTSRLKLEPLSALGRPTLESPVADNNIYWGGTQTNGFRVVYPDGSKDIYGLAFQLDGQSTAKAFLTQQIDAQGRITRLGYEKTNIVEGPTYVVFRPRYLVDPDGRTNTFKYVNGTRWHLEQITDPYGRTALVEYGPMGSQTTGIRALIDAQSMTNRFTYVDDGGWLSTLITPYGTTSFSYFQEQETADPEGFIRRAVLVTEPNNAQQLFYYRHTNNDVMISGKTDVPTVPNYALDVGTNGGDHHELFYRNTFHWDRRQFAALSVTNWSNLSTALSNVTSNDFRKAHLQHWLLGSDGTNITESVSSEREPSPDAQGLNEGAWTWYDYPNKNGDHPEQESPYESLVGCVARLLPDGTSQYRAVDFYSDYGVPHSQIETVTKPDGSVGGLTNWFYAGYPNVQDLTSVSNSLGQSVKITYANHLPTYITNTLGQVTTLNWDATTGNYAGTSLIGGQTATLTYYASNSTTANGGFLQNITWSPGPSWSIGYDKGLPKAATNDMSLVVSFTWDDLLRPTSVSFPGGSYTSNRYDKLDLIATRDRLGNWTYFGYDALRHLTAITNANNAVTRLDWCDCGALASVTDALTNTTSFYYDNQGRQTNVVFRDNSSVKYFYDSVGRLTNVVDGASRSLKLGYNNQGLLTTVSNAYGRMWQVVFDALSRPQQITDANNVTVTNAYDLLNRLTNRIWADGFGESFVWSTNGLTAYTNRNGKATRFTRDKAGRVLGVTNANLEVTAFGYNSLSEVTNLWDGRTNRTQWTYDEYGRRRSKLDALNRTTSWDYNVNGWLTNRTTEQFGNTAYAYDPVGNLTNIAYPSSSIAYAFNALNQLTNMIDAAGTTKFTYTAAGQLASEDGPWSDDVVTNTYTEGLRTAMAIGSAWSQTYHHDSAWRIDTLTSPAGTFTYGYGSSPASLIRTLSLPNTAFITNHYDSLSRLDYTALAQSSGRVLDGYGYTYDRLGLRTNIARNFGFATSTVTAGYDAIGQLTSWTAKESSGTSRLNEQLGWNYDLVGSLHYRTNNALVQTFTPDNANELADVTRSGTFTAIGNTTTPATNVTVNGTTASRYTDNTWAAPNFTLTNGNNTFANIAQNPYGFSVTNSLTLNLPTSVTLAFDLNGNLTDDGLRSFSYDSENQLVTNWVAGAWKTEFVYDGFGRRRISRDYGWTNSAWLKTNESRLVYDGSLPIEERDANNALLVAYTRGLDLSGSLQGAGGIGGLLARSDTNGTAFYHADGAGNITALMNTNQLIVGKYLYDPFGNLLAMSGPSAPANVMRFSSKPLLPHADDIYDFGGRDWFTRPQRWGSPDPLGEGSDVNLYRGMGNSPVNVVDPYGLRWAVFDPQAWQQLFTDIFVGDTKSPGWDPNSKQGLSGSSGLAPAPIYDANGNVQSPGNAVLEVGAAVPKGFIAAGTILPLGGEEAALAVGDKIYRGSKLARNCAKAGKPILKGLERSHHIVAKAAQAAEEARQKLKNLGINVDDAFNGIGLPTKFHETLHTKEYYEIVNQASRNWNTYDEAVKGLTEIANTLLEAAGAK